MSESSPKVVTLYPHNFRDIPNTLRYIADAIEKGEHGELRSCAVVLQKSNGAITDVFGLGSGEGADTVGILFSGAQYVSNILTKEREQ